MARIASLLPSATEIVAALGFQKDLIARSHECDFPEGVKSLPAVTQTRFETEGTSPEIDRRVQSLVERGLSLYQVDADKLKQLKPEIIITQNQCEVCAVSESELERALSDWVGQPAKIVSLQPDSLEEIWQDFIKVGHALKNPSRAKELIQNIQREMKKISEKIPSGDPMPKVACIEWLDPLMVAGNWMPELVQMAGGKNIIGEIGKHSPYVAWESLLDEDPEVILLLPCGFDIPRTRSEIDIIKNKPGWKEINAVKNGRVFIGDGNQYFNRPGPRILDSLKILAEIIHPHIFTPQYEMTGWEKIPSS